MYLAIQTNRHAPNNRTVPQVVCLQLQLSHMFLQVNHLQFCKYGSSVDRKEGLREERERGRERERKRERELMVTCKECIRQ